MPIQLGSRKKSFTATSDQIASRSVRSCAGEARSARWPRHTSTPTASESAAAAASQSAAGRVNTDICSASLVGAGASTGAALRHTPSRPSASQPLPVATPKGARLAAATLAPLFATRISSSCSPTESRGASSTVRGWFQSAGAGSSAIGCASSRTTAAPVVRSASGALAGTSSTAKRVR